MSDITQEELTLLIEQTYKVEKEFTDLKTSYVNLQNTVENIVEFLPNAIWILNDDNTIFLQNSQAKKLQELFERLETRSDDYEITYNDKSYLIKSLIHEGKNMISATDITEQKRKENLATMGQMAAHLSHEIRNPIGSIALLSSTLKKRVIEKNIPIVEEIQKAVYKIERIIKATLMFSKGMNVNKQNFMLRELQSPIEEAITYYGYSKEISFKFPTQNFVIHGDKDLLEMMFNNFISNAIDAIELDDDEEGAIEISYDEDKKYHKFYIYDSGVAIENKKDLFQAFKSSKVKGNGLGLVLSQQIAQAHGGSVRLLEGDKKIFEIKLKK